MGSSFIDYRDRGFWTRDSYAALWLYPLCTEIELETEPLLRVADAFTALLRGEII